MSKLLIPHGLSTAELYAFRSIEEELNKLANGGSLTKGSGQPTLTSNLQDGSLYYDYTNLNLYVFSGSTTPNAEAVVTNGVTSQWRSSAGIAEASAASAQTTANTANIAANAASSAANSAQGTANAASSAAATATANAATATANAASATSAAASATASANAAAINALAIQVSLFGSGNAVSNNTLSAGAGALTGGRSFYVVGQYVQADLFNANSIVTSGSLAGSNASGIGVLGRATSSSTSAHGIRGQNTSNSRSGLVGPANAFDFYAENAGTYGPFTGSHDALMLLAETATEGDILIDTTCVCRGNLSNTIFASTKSTSSNQKAAIGIYAGSQGLLANQYEPAAFVISRDEDGVPTLKDEWQSVNSNYNLVSVNSVGEGQINIIGEAGNLVPGDLIVTSSTPGKGMKQSDDIVRACTVAKVREAVTFSSLTEEKQVACIYLCG
jgi:hypothetical protein